MTAKVILVMIDGLRDSTAAQQMGYLEHLVEHRVAERYTVIAEMPTMSRPLYETIHTGVPPHEHGIVSNNIVRRSTKPNVFEIAHTQGKTTAAASYYWVSELYNAAPFKAVEHGEIDDVSCNIQHGRFYGITSFPDSELLTQADRLVKRFEPDYLLVHPIGMDDMGHKFGAASNQYNNQAIFIDQFLAGLLPAWMARGYHLVITADHGINEHQMHGGSSADVRNVPLYLLRHGVTAQRATHEPVSQLQVAPTVLKLLDLPIPDTMKASPLI